MREITEDKSNPFAARAWYSPLSGDFSPGHNLFIGVYGTWNGGKINVVEVAGGMHPSQSWPWIYW